MSYEIEYILKRRIGFETKEELKEFIKVNEIADVVYLKEYVKTSNLQARKDHYPSVEEVIEAMLDGNIENIQEKRDEVKRKYPLEDKPSSYKVELEWKRFRDKRDNILLRTDYTQLADASLTSEEKKEFRGYRKYLKDVTKNYNNITIWEASILSFEDWKEGD